MACRLFGANPLSELILAYCYVDHWGQITVKFQLTSKHFSLKKIHLKMCRKWWPFCLGLNILIRCSEAHQLCLDVYCALLYRGYVISSDDISVPFQWGCGRNEPVTQQNRTHCEPCALWLRRTSYSPCFIYDLNSSTVSISLLDPHKETSCTYVAYIWTKIVKNITMTS